MVVSVTLGDRSRSFVPGLSCVRVCVCVCVCAPWNALVPATLERRSEPYTYIIREQTCGVA